MIESPIRSGYRLNATVLCCIRKHSEFLVVANESEVECMNFDSLTPADFVLATLLLDIRQVLRLKCIYAVLILYVNVLPQIRKG